MRRVREATTSSKSLISKMSGKKNNADS